VFSAVGHDLKRIHCDREEKGTRHASEEFSDSPKDELPLLPATAEGRFRQLPSRKGAIPSASLGQPGGLCGCHLQTAPVLGEIIALFFWF
jgi:hypothetical protein